jgi:hypothetical protein
MFENIDWFPTLALTYIVMLPIFWIWMARWLYRNAISETDSWGIAFCFAIVWPASLVGACITIAIEILAPFLSKPINFLLKYKNSKSPKG